MTDKRTLADFGRESFTPILGVLVPWDGSVVIGGERIFIVVDHGQIVEAEIPSTAQFWSSAAWGRTLRNNNKPLGRPARASRLYGLEHS